MWKQVDGSRIDVADIRRGDCWAALDAMRDVFGIVEAFQFSQRLRHVQAAAVLASLAAEEEGTQTEDATNRLVKVDNWLAQWQRRNAVPFRDALAEVVENVNLTFTTALKLVS